MADQRPFSSLHASKFGRKNSKSIDYFLGLSKPATDKLDSLPDVDHESKSFETKSQECFKYFMNRKHRGNFLIFNHQKFSIEAAPERVGTELDRNNLSETAADLGFTVSIHDDMKRESIELIIKQHASSDHTECDCFACVVLTHGESGGQLYAEDEKYHINSLIEPFQKCKSLEGKPKLFFIQACRGREFDHGTKSDGNDTLDAGIFGEEKEREICIPLSADVFVGYSTVEGYFAWRNEENGSWFIQSLCACLKEHKEMEFLQIMTRVNRMVAYDYESCCDMPKCDKKKQMPSVVSQLTKDLYFHVPPTETVDGKLFKTKTKSKKKSLPTEKLTSLKEQALKVKLDILNLSKQEEEKNLELLSLKKKIYLEKLKNL